MFSVSCHSVFSQLSTWRKCEISANLVWGFISQNIRKMFFFFCIRKRPGRNSRGHVFTLFHNWRKQGSEKLSDLPKDLCQWLVKWGLQTQWSWLHQDFKDTSWEGKWVHWLLTTNAVQMFKMNIRSFSKLRLFFFLSRKY